MIGPSVITGDTALCIGVSTQLSEALFGGTWSSGATTIATVSNTGTVTALSAGTAVITYSGACGSATTTVTVHALPDVGTITGSATACLGIALVLSDAAAGGAWSSSNTGVATVSPTGSVTALSAGTDTVRYIVSSPSCGSDTAIKIITINNGADAGSISGDTLLCTGSTISLSDNAGGGAWSSGNTGVAAVSGIGSVTGLSPGTAQVRYTVSNACGSDTAIKAITVLAAPDAGSISGPGQLCVGAAAAMSDTAGGGAWSTSGSAASVSGAGVVHALAQGMAVITYTVSSNVGGCTAAATYTLTITAQSFTISSEVQQPPCYGGTGSISISGQPSWVYIWSNVATTPVITGLDTGQYIVNITDTATDCATADTFHIMQPDSLSINATVQDDMCGAGTGSISLAVSGGTGGYTYTWSNSATAKDLENLQQGAYSVTVTDSNGCTKDLAATVLEDTCNNIIVHDAITPNGDGKNDTWVIEGISQYPGNSVQVFDKWGDIVYQKNGYSNDWDGNKLPDGTYYYLVKLNASNLLGGKNVFTGSMLIKR